MASAAGGSDASTGKGATARAFTTKSQGVLHDYTLTLTREDDVLKRLRDETTEKCGSKIVMQITADQGAFMRILAASIGTKNAIEVGTFTGYSALCVAQALPKGGKIVCCDVSEEWTNIGKKYWEEAGVTDKIDLRIAPALETLDALLAEGKENGFDFAFIDADKVSYKEYYERCIKLIRPGGIIAIDNVHWHGRVVDSSVADEDTVAIRALNDFIYKDDRVDPAMLSLGDGVTLCRVL